MQLCRKSCDGQTCGHPLLQTNSAPPHHLRWSHQYPVLHNLWQQIQSDYLPYTLQLQRDLLHLASAGWAQVHATSHCSELATGQLLLQTYPNFEKDVASRLNGEELLHVEYSTFVFQHESLLSTEEFARLEASRERTAL